MTTLEKIDGLSPETKGWLHRAVNQIAESSHYTPNAEALRECVAAGIIEKDQKSWLRVPVDVMEIVYSKNYLAEFDNL